MNVRRLITDVADVMFAREPALRTLERATVVILVVNDDDDGPAHAWSATGTPDGGVLRRRANER